MNPHDEPRGARLSSSHGALNACYSLPTRASSVILDSGLHLVPYFKPLRSIREHGHTFLDPAASADGMLRKTTETGNIGLFSINTGTPTPLRSRASLGDLRQPHRPLDHASSVKPSAHDDRKRLPSYRDSTSEIISMYGSDNQSSAKSVSGTLSPPWDECGQRSNSMTTCGSKSYTLPRNMGTQQPHDAHLGAQRPRSPYPYPTRLPRPGIRPSSPALTENGSVDYSRMVEIDRIPQRTVHHPHKPLFPFKTMRDQPAPLSMRYGINQSTRSLSDEHGPTRILPTPMPRRPPLPTHIHPWGLRPRHRLGSESSGQSMRTMSLTSSNGGYNYAPPQTPASRVPEKKPPIFYDYSEDFEDAVAPPPDLPMANPTPTRMSKCFRPNLSDDDCDNSSESADEGVGHVVEYLRRMTMIESNMGQDKDEHQHRESSGEHAKDYIFKDHRSVSQLQQGESPAQSSPDQPAEEVLAPSPVLRMLSQTVDSSYISAVSPDDHQDTMAKGHSENLNHTMESTANGLVSEASTVESPVGPETPNHETGLPPAELAHYEDHAQVSKHHDQHENSSDDEMANEDAISRMILAELVTNMASESGLPNGLSASLPYRYSSARKDSRFYSISSGLSDLASFVKNVDKHMQTLDHEHVEQEDTPVADRMPGTLSARGRPECQNIDETSAPPRKSSLANQRRSYAGPQGTTADPADELERYQVVSTRSGPTLVPQPISPAKLLRLKNSIPQLMKALPPLPSYSPASESAYNPTIVPVEFEPFEFSRLTDARSTLIEEYRTQSQDEEAPEVYDPFVFDRAIRKPKLKLKTPSSHQSSHVRRTRPRQHESGSITPSESCGMRQSSTGEYSTAPVKRRLPIKVSRPTLESLTAEDTGTVKRRPGIDKSSTFSELASLQPVDLFSPATALEMAVHHTKFLAGEQSTTSDREYGTLPVVKATSMAKIAQVNVVDEGRGASLDTQLDALHSPRTRIATTTDNVIQSFFNETPMKPQRGLRKRLSNLKSRLTESRHHQQGYTISTSVGEDVRDKPASRSHSPSAVRDLVRETSAAQDPQTVTRPRTVRGKWGKLLKGARHRLRTWGKNRHKDQ